MKKSTIAAQSSAGIAALALLTTLTHADSLRYSELSSVELDMQNAAMVASEATAGDIIEIELETDDAKAVWEIDIVNDSNQLITVEIDGQTGEVLSTSVDDDTAMPLVSAVSLSQAIDVVKAVEQGAIIEAELEHDDGVLIWEVESIDSNNQESTFRVNAETGEILI